MIKADKILDDMARVAGGTVGVLAGIKDQIKSDLKAYIDDVADRMDLVPREDFDRLEAQVAELHKKIEAQDKALKDLNTAKKDSKSKPSNPKHKKA